MLLKLPFDNSLLDFCLFSRSTALFTALVARCTPLCKLVL
jgi:hypothetical protein